MTLTSLVNIPETKKFIKVYKCKHCQCQVRSKLSNLPGSVTENFRMYEKKNPENISHLCDGKVSSGELRFLGIEREL